jgi:hypothetical protein
VLAKNGWWQGDPGSVLKAPAKDVIAAYQYEIFNQDLETTTMEINKPRT